VHPDNSPWQRPVGPNPQPPPADQRYLPLEQPYPPAGQGLPIVGQPYARAPRPPRGSNKIVWVVGGVAATVLAIVLVVVLVVMSAGSKSNGSNSSSVARQSSKSDIAHLTESMLVDESSFPSINGAHWKSGVVTQSAVNSQFRPTECGAILGAVNATESGVAMLIGTGKGKSSSAMVGIYLPTELLDVKTIQSGCSKIDDMPNPTAEWKTKPIDLAGVPSWAGGLLLNDTAVKVFGTYRGVFINSSCDISRKDDAVKLFNDELAKLEAA
jgi:hypothetical protein